MKYFRPKLFLLCLIASLGCVEQASSLGIDTGTNTSLTDSLETPDSSGTNEDSAVVDHVCNHSPFQIINYYPAEYAWKKMWLDWSISRTAMNRDMQLAKDLGANAVRFFIHPQLFGMDNTDHRPNATQIEMLNDALDITSSNGLFAVPTLFDLWGEMHMKEESKAWLEGMMQPFDKDDRIAMWQLKNEVDLTQPNQLSWVTDIFPHFRQLAGKTPVTLSISAAKQNSRWRESLETMVSVIQPDYYDIHWYTRDEVTWTGSLERDLQDAVSIVGNPNCIILGELGQTTSDFYSAESQNDVFSQIFYYSHKLGIPHLGLWTLWDFPEGTHIGTEVVASGDELHYGLYRTDGTPKPSVETIRQMFNGTAPELRNLVLHNTSFEATDYRSGNPEGWRGWAHPPGANGNIAFDASTAHTGNASVRLTVTQSAISGTSAVYGIYHVPAMPVDMNQLFGVDCWIKANGLPDDDDSFAQIVVSWFSWDGESDAQWIGQSAGPSLHRQTSDTWTQMTFPSIAPPAEAAFAQIFLQVRATAPGVSVWFDDLTLTTAPAQ